MNSHPLHGAGAETSRKTAELVGHRHRHTDQLTSLLSFPWLASVASIRSISFLRCAVSICSLFPGLFSKAFSDFEGRNNLRSSASNLKPRTTERRRVAFVAPSRRRPDRLKCKNSAAASPPGHSKKSRDFRAAFLPSFPRFVSWGVTQSNETLTPPVCLSRFLANNILPQKQQRSNCLLVISVMISIFKRGSE